MNYFDSVFSIKHNAVVKVLLIFQLSKNTSSNRFLMFAWNDASLNGSLTGILRCFKKLPFRLMLPCVINVLVFSGLKVSINLYFSNKRMSLLFNEGFRG
jgi:hypothetical protein